MPHSKTAKKIAPFRHRRPTLRQVADIVGVNPSTVSSILNGGRRAEGFAESTKERVRSVAEELGYVANPLARTLRQSATHLLGVVVMTRQTGFFKALVQGVKERAHEQRYEVLDADMEDDAGRFMHCIQSLTAWRIEGLVLITGGDAACRRPMESVSLNDLPCVELACGTDHSSVPSVNFDNERAGRMMAGHLASLGHQRVGVLAGPKGNRLYDERLKGFLTHANEKGVEVAERDIVRLPQGRCTMSAGRDVCASLMQKWPRPTALIGINDAIAIGATRGLRGMGIDVPRQVSVAGFDDVCFEVEDDENRLADYVYPALTTVRAPLRDMGHETVSKLLSLIRGEAIDEQSRHVKFPPKLITRDSTARCVPGHARPL